jgi:hypothetical protein
VIDRVPRLKSGELAELTITLHSAGKPIRSIAGATGQGKSTVARQLAGVPFGTATQSDETRPASPRRPRPSSPA